MKRNFWTTKETIQLKELYTNGFKAGDGKLDDFCLSINRTKQLVCRKAKQLKLTSHSRGLSQKECTRISEMRKDKIKINGHPKGMLGKHHTEETKSKTSERSLKMWADPNSKVNSDKNRQRLSDNASKQTNLRLSKNATSIYSRTKHGTITIGGKTLFARSSWEANIAAYFEV